MGSTVATLADGGRSKRPIALRRNALRKPVILRFAADTFMDDFVEPARNRSVTMHELVAIARNVAWTSNRSCARKTSSAFRAETESSRTRGGEEERPSCPQRAAKVFRRY